MDQTKLKNIIDDKQTIGGYSSNAIALEASPETKAALDAFMKGYVRDVQTLLGLLK